MRDGISGGPVPIANLLPTAPHRSILAVVDMSEASARALRAARTALGLLGDGPEQPA